ncbi:MAG: transcription-repair coupling factor [Gammaproteobacteria bacterium]|nr:transcription-repair coupling factor [Gammaproteobacteria bacterium]
MVPTLSHLLESWRPPKAALGKRFQVQFPLPSGDSAWLGLFSKINQPMVIITDNAQTCRRLAEEIPLMVDGLNVVCLPDWETLPYERISPHQDLIGERVSTLWQLIHQQFDLLILPINTALQRITPRSFVASHTFIFSQGSALPPQKIQEQLHLASYQRVSQVYHQGEFAMRGSLIDIFPMGSHQPMRLDFDDNILQSISYFDIKSQRRTESLSTVKLLPAKEFPMDQTTREWVSSRWEAMFSTPAPHSVLLKSLEQGIPMAGSEYYLPLFFSELEPIFSYLPPETPIILYPALEDMIAAFWQDVEQRYQFTCALYPDHPPVPPEHLFLRQEKFFLELRKFPCISLRSEGDKSGIANLPSNTHLGNASTLQETYLRLLLGTQRKTVFFLHSLGRMEALQANLQGWGYKATLCKSLEEFINSGASVGILPAYLTQGFIWPLLESTVVCEKDLWPHSSRHKTDKPSGGADEIQQVLQSLVDLKIGAPIVHTTYGVGRYQGLVRLDFIKSPDNEFVHILYANNSSVYIPIYQLHLVHRYTGADPDLAPLHALGSGQWEKAKRKATEQISDIALDLLNSHALRAASVERQLDFPLADYHKFALSFGYHETPDQKLAIDAVLKDMNSPHKMDRLICGDVGFGKTEVALRAIFIAISRGDQVAFLAPTTLLVEQHYQTLCNRFANWPITIAELSRFQSAKETKDCLNKLADGRIDVVIGTHKLLGTQVKFKNLGLLIIDEEQRFGVRQKETIQSIRHSLDVLTLTATPIPRTLGFALEGVRALSIIATPPKKRLSIKTILTHEGNAIIRDAIIRELRRGGQCFFLHNDVASMPDRLRYLTRLLPEARIVMAHGQMPEHELEVVMREFIQQKSQVLLCSTIIETGIDIPNANTIIISGADKLGLSQLHQIRGRVGRSHHQAYAYLLVADIANLNKKAKERLEAIVSLDELGSGYYLAVHDLEMRGIGEILGENQTGNVASIGFNLYHQMLQQAISAHKKGLKPNLMRSDQPVGTDINLHLPAFIPDTYCPDIQHRLSLYQRFSQCTSKIELEQLEIELVDRFGQIPEPTHHLILQHSMRIACQRYGVLKLDANAQQMTLTFTEDAPIDADKVLVHLKKNPHIRFTGNNQLVYRKSHPKLELRIALVEELLENLRLDR